MDSNTINLLTLDEVKFSSEQLKRLHDKLSHVILGQPEVLNNVVTTLFAGGHILLEGLPGLGKTELVKSLATLLGLQFKRIQFTPDLLPSDILGSPILEEQSQSRKLVFHPGPVFTNLLLADEINRTTPKTQAALLEAMQERSVTVMGETRSLPLPFFVLATQNPIEMEGTYPLPEAQLDRFMVKINIPSVSATTIEEIIATRSNGQGPVLNPLFPANDLANLMSHVRRVHLPTAVRNYIARLVAATHADSPSAPDFVKQHVRHGASPRAALAIAEMSKSAALLNARPNAGFDDVKHILKPVLRHRLIMDYSARLDNVTPDVLLDQLVSTIPEVDHNFPPDLKL